MNILVGGRQQIASVSLLVPAGEDAWVEFTADTWDVRINVVFNDDKENPQQGFSLDGKDDHAVLTIKNWNTGLPAALTEPFSLGETEGKKVLFLFSGYAVGGLKRLDLSFFWEKQENV